MSAHLQRAELLLDQSRPAEAEREVSLALARDPENAHAHALLARSRLAQQRAVEAIDAARKAVALAPDVAYHHTVLGYALLEADREKDALAAANAALALDPEDASVFVLRSSVHLARRAWSEALADAEAAIGLEPEHVHALNLRSIALTQLGRNEEAHQSGNFALHRAPENGMAHATKGWACLHEGDTAGAQDHFRESLRLQPDLEYARQGMLEALKARNPVYRGLLAYFLWMGRQSTRIQWAFILFTLFGLRVIRGLAASNPGLGLILWPVVVLCYAFIYLSWTAGPMFNLLLRFNRFGRLVLSRDERRGSTVFGLSLLPILGGGLWWMRGGGEVAVFTTIAAAMLSVCVAATVNREGRARRILALATGALAIVGTLALAAAATGRGASLLSLFFLGFLAFQFLANGLRR
jgi:Flp pilus assembly protein TadD